MRVIVENSDRTLFLRVRDNGMGISEEQVSQLNAQFSNEIGTVPLAFARQALRCGMSTAGFV